MRLRLTGIGDALRSRRRLIWGAILAALLVSATTARAADATATGGEMSSAGWVEQIAMKLESEAMSDVGMLPDTSDALVREWRSFDRNGSSLGALINFAWVVLAGFIALMAERGVARGLSRRVRRLIEARSEALTLGRLLLLLLCDLVGVAAFAGVFVWSRHWMIAVGVTMNLIVLAANWLIRWRLIMLIPRVVLRPNAPVARLIEVSDAEARRLVRFVSITVLAIVLFVGFGRYGLQDEDSGAPHIVGLIVATMTCALNSLIVLRTRDAAEALIRGRSGGLLGALRAAIARAWLAIGLTIVIGLLVLFVFGLSLGLLSYFQAIVTTIGVFMVVLVVERMTERGWHDAETAVDRTIGADRLVSQGCHRILRAIVLCIAAVTLAWIWIDAIDLPPAEAARAVQSSIAAVLTLFTAYIAWELARLAIDRHLQNVVSGPKLPGSDDEDETAPGSRLQTILPILRAGLGVLIAVVVALIVLSHLGIDTAPLIAGAGVFGLAISFGAQSLVRDIISGLFYLWDDAFRVGEYIDTGRLKGSVEALGIRSVKLRHHNGPLHTIPYGQLGAVNNQSRDFATIKFNLRLEPGTDVELVRKTAKQLGIAMQEIPEIAAEVMLPLKLQGIAEVADNAVVFRFKFTARPVKPSWVQREYLKAMYRVFAEKGIAFASGALTLQTVPPRGGPFGLVEGDAAPLLTEAIAAPAPAASRVA